MNNSAPDNVIAIEGYSLIRNDRSYSQGGGICVYYKNDLNCISLCHSEISVGMRDPNLAEYLFIEVSCYNEKFSLAVFYNPPRNDCSETFYYKIVELGLDYSQMIIVGDLNTDISKINSRSSRLCSVIDAVGLNCVSFEPTHYFPGGCSLIDLMLTSNSDFVLKFNKVSAPGFSRHDIIFASLHISRNRPSMSPCYYRDYKRIDLPVLQSAILAID